MDLTSIRGRILLIAAVLLPIIVLGSVAFQKARISAEGIELRFPIDGYDPRDIIAGHYLVYSVDYGTNACQGPNRIKPVNRSQGDAVCLCLTDTLAVPPVSHPIDCEDIDTADCRAVLKGRCERGRFTAGLERYYINEEKAAELDRIVRQGKSRIVVKVDRKGEAIVQSLETP